MHISNLEKSNSLNINSPMASMNFSIMLSKHIDLYFRPPNKELVLLCIGTDRSTGDALGPIVGHKLSRPLSRYNYVHLYGTLDEPVHAKNLNEKLKTIHSSLDKPFIIAVDACLGKMDRIGCIAVNKGPLKPGAGVSKDLPAVGDISITGIVNLGGYMEYLVLQNTRLSLVVKMADTLAQSIKYSIWRLHRERLMI
ncbi:MAG: spore protease YyaC [Candidatus Alkaliphilus sp. MAG34]|nr:spore protease YyaC [Clostridiales bacterium]